MESLKQLQSLMEWLHIFGICHDSTSHIDLLDFFLLNNQELIWYFQKNKLFLSIIKRKWQQQVNIMATSLSGLRK